jgi:hypothetical protein
MLVGKLEGKRLHGTCGHGWESNIEINFKVIVWDAVDWC